MLKRLLPDNFLILIIATVLLASNFPPDRAIGAIISNVSSVAIFALFFFHGAKIPASALKGALVHWRLHAIILAFTFVAFPLLAILLRACLHSLLPDQLWVGVFFMCALPSTVQSSIAFTSLARGNVAGAVAAASVSQVLGILLTPLLVGVMVGAKRSEVNLEGLQGVIVQILVPFALGQFLRKWIGDWVARNKSTIFITDRVTILLSIFSAFSTAVREGIWKLIGLEQLLVLFVICIITLVIMLGATFWVGFRGGFTREDRIALQFCATKKSLVQGIPMAKVLFPGTATGVALLPIMIFHQAQLMACAWIANHYARNSNNV